MLNLNLAQTNMALPRLRKEYLDMVPEFQGDKELLSHLIEICDFILTKFYNTVDINDFQNLYLYPLFNLKLRLKRPKIQLAAPLLPAKNLHLV